MAPEKQEKLGGVFFNINLIEYRTKGEVVTTKDENDEDVTTTKIPQSSQKTESRDLCITADLGNLRVCK